MHDRDDKDRSMHGERHVRAKLTEDDVREIRRAAAAGASVLSLSKRFEMRHRTIACVVRRDTWKRVH